MAILISKGPPRIYQSAGGVEISQADCAQADRLDAELSRRIERLVESLKKKGLMPKKKGKGTLMTYWEMGKVLREITVNKKDFPSEAELPFLWRNAKMYLPEELQYKERGPHREHLWYCYRLAGYPKKLVQKMRWGEWVTIFDSPGINQEPRFDKWFHEKLLLQNKPMDREQIRMFAPCINKLLGRIDVQDLSELELFNCYEATWQIASSWYARKVTDPTHSYKLEEIQKSIVDNFVLLDKVMDGNLSPGDFASRILSFTDGN
jgi:hypothetical protein